MDFVKEIEQIKVFLKDENAVNRWFFSSQYSEEQKQYACMGDEYCQVDHDSTASSKSVSVVLAKSSRPIDTAPRVKKAKKATVTTTNPFDYDNFPSTSTSSEPSTNAWTFQSGRSSQDSHRPSTGSQSTADARKSQG
ncbi:hypothetical protein P7C71_g2805, partial [Lecanoromycetidae sp. Uapishka_2]